MMRMAMLLGVCTLVLGACGARRDLRPKQGESLPVAPYGATTVPKSRDLLAPTPQQRPQRSDELLRDSVERAPDPFDLPPTR